MFLRYILVYLLVSITTHIDLDALRYMPIDWQMVSAPTVAKARLMIATLIDVGKMNSYLRCALDNERVYTLCNMND